MSCRATGTPYPQVSWTRRDGLPISSRITEDYPGVITLREATIEDAGLYECKATNVAGTATLTASITIQQPPVITLSPDVQSIEVTEGDELRFTCSATGIPTPSVQIKVPDGAPAHSPVLPLHRGRVELPEATINYVSAHRSQAGLYQCVAINDAGQDLRYIQVNVKEKRGDVGFEDDRDRDDENEVDNRGDWEREQREREHREREQREREREREQREREQRERDREQGRRPYPPPDHEGTPVDGGSYPEQSAFTVHLGERAEFNCRGEDNLMRTEWRRSDRRELPFGARIQGGQLVIENVRNDAAGAYECVAYNSATRRSVTLLVARLVVVAGPPKISFSPPMPIVVKSGEDVLIYCNATGEGPLSVHWHGENGALLPK